ncbi:cupin domain-containing protein [Cryptosporangium sp. NPDC048952]|uniref:cupin domain-containing protein n=1 Tax=Cryptosporangium sp. NPDC048952 TaxID=3363961 RepID=UPI003723BBB2
MRIIRGEGPSEQRPANVTGSAWFDPVLPATDGTVITTVFFAPGARTFWHTHEHGQILQVLSGRGLICSDGGTPQVLAVGDTVWVPAGERHWHGAAPDSFLSHTAISLGTTSWAEEVSETDYAS